MQHRFDFFRHAGCGKREIITKIDFTDSLPINPMQLGENILFQFRIIFCHTDRNDIGLWVKINQQTFDQQRIMHQRIASLLKDPIPQNKFQCFSI